MTSSFIFPVDFEQLNKIKDLLHLRQILQNLYSRANISKQLYRIGKSNIYIYCRCRFCICKMNFKKSKQQDCFVLSTGNNKHNHKITMDKEIIKTYIKKLPSTMELRSQRDVTLQSFSITKGQFYYLHRKLQPHRNFRSLITSLNQQGFQTRYAPFPLDGDSIPNTLVTIAPYMLQNYRKSGKVISYDITYNLIKERCLVIDNGTRKEVRYGVGLFMVKNHVNKLVPVAISMTNSQNTQSFCDLLYSFFTMVDQSPSLIISDQQKSFLSALDILKKDQIWTGQSILDQFHILYNLKKKTKNNDLINSLKALMYCETPAEFDKLLSIAYSLAESESQVKIVTDFQTKKNKICLTQSPVSFIGLHMSTSSHQKIHDLLKQHIKYEMNAVVVFDKILKFLEKTQTQSSEFKICKTRYEELFQDSQLRSVRLSFCSAVYERFILIYARSLPLIIVKKEEEYWEFDDGEAIKLRGQHYICSCFMSERLGIPCKHQLKVLKKLQLPYHRYFSDYWTSPQSQIQAPMERKIIVKKGRPRISRRRYNN